MRLETYIRKDNEKPAKKLQKARKWSKWVNERLEEEKKLKTPLQPTEKTNNG